MLPDIECSASLRQRGLWLAREAPADEPAMRALYIRHRLPEFSALPMLEAAKLALVGGQFDMQRNSYRASHPDARFLALFAHGVVAGRLYLASVGADVLLLDILIAEDLRGAGVGRDLIEALKQGAFANGQGVLLHVDKTNRARTLYERLGFRVTGDAEVSWAMAARPST